MKWEKVKLGDLAICIQPGPFGSQLHSSDYADEGTPIIMPKDMIDGKISQKDLIRVPDKHLQRLKRHQVFDGDLMVARKGDVRKCVYITKNENGWLTGSDCLKVSLDKEKCFPKYIYYQLRSPFMGRWLETISIGATMPSVNTGLLSGIEIFLPTIEEQKRIAGILSAYDSLIENNQEQIKLLEEAAQRLYKEWFVDLRFPGYETTPIVDGIPQGWERMVLSEVTSVLKRGISPKYSDNGKYYVINQKCIRSSIMDISESRRQEKEYVPTLNLQDSDTVICSTGTGTLGRVGRVYGDYPNTTFDSHVTLVRAKENPNYIYHVVKSQQEYLMGMGRGSTNQQELYRDVIERLVVLCPSQDILLKADRALNAIHCKIKTVYLQNNLLVESRDRLLPKLMSGEIEV